MHLRTIVISLLAVLAFSYLLLSVIVPIGETIQTTGLVIYTKEPGAFWLATYRGVNLVDYKTEGGCSSSGDTQFRPGQILEIKGIFVNSSYISICRQPEGFIKRAGYEIVAAPDSYLISQ